MRPATVVRDGDTIRVTRDASGDAHIGSTPLPDLREGTYIVVDPDCRRDMHDLDPWVVSDLIDVVQGQVVVLSPGYGAADASGLAPARRLAERLGVPVTGPTGAMCTSSIGLFADGPDAAWVVCSPEGEQRRLARRQPAPAWQAALPDGGDGIVPLPAGLWVPPTGSTRGNATPLQALEPGEHPLVVVGAPDAQPPTAQHVVDVLRLVPERMRSEVLLAGWGHRSLPDAAGIARDVGLPIRVAHGLPLRTGFAELDLDGRRRWCSFGIESMVHPDGRRTTERWSVPPGLDDVARNTYVLVDGWHIDVLPGGLLVRPNEPGWATDALRPRIEAGPDSMPEVVVTTGSRGMLGEGVGDALAELLERWDVPARARIRPADTAARLGVAQVFEGQYVEFGRRRRTRDAAGRGLVTVTRDGRIVVAENDVPGGGSSVPDESVVVPHRHSSPLPATDDDPVGTPRAQLLGTLRSAFDRLGATPWKPAAPWRSDADREVARPRIRERSEPPGPDPAAPESMPTRPTSPAPVDAHPSRDEDEDVGRTGEGASVASAVAAFAGHVPQSNPVDGAVADVHGSTSGNAPRPSSTRVASPAPAPSGAAAVAVPADGQRPTKPMHLPNVADSVHGTSAADWSIEPETVIPTASQAQPTTVAPVLEHRHPSPAPALADAARAHPTQAPGTEVAPGQPSPNAAAASRPPSASLPEEPAPTSERPPAAPPEVEAAARSTPEQRRDLRAELGARFDIASRAVSRALAERPGIHTGDTDAAALLTQLAVVHLFAERPNETYDTAFATVLAEGLRLMPTVRRVVVRGLPKDSDLGEDGVLRVTAPLLAAPVDGALTGDTEALIWTTSGRRLDAIFDPSGVEGEVVLTAHSSYEVVGREPGPVPRVLLAECGSSREKALGRLKDVAKSRDALTERADSDRWCGPVLMRA